MEFLRFLLFTWMSAKKTEFNDLNAYWLVGFVDGEGCFSVSFNRKPSMVLGIEARPSFSVSQKSHSYEVLESIQNYLGCGGIRFSKSDGTYKFEVRSLAQLRANVLPFFLTYRLLTNKRHDFEKFEEVCDLIAGGQHLNVAGLSKIVELAYAMNGSGKRKYSKEELLKFFNKLKL